MDENNVNFVAPDTDDLDDFDLLFNGKAEVKTETDEPVKDEDIKQDAIPEDQEPEDNEPEEDSLEDSDESDDSEEEAPKPPKKKQSVQERISELTRARREAERRQADTQRQLDEILAKLEDKTPVQPKTTETAGPSPEDKLENGEDKYPLGEFDPQYIRDLTKFTVKQETEAARAETLREAEENRKKQETEALGAEWAVKLEKAREVYEDIDEQGENLVDAFSSLDPAYAEYLAATIMSMDHGADVLYYLATNLSEADKLVKMTPTKATLALGRIESRFDKTETPTKKVSSAPTPPPATRGNAARTSIPDDTDDLDAFEKKFFKKR